jgi:hypothetical protein
MLTNAEMWIAVVFCVGCKNFITVECEPILCLLIAHKLMTRKHDKCVVYLHVVSNISFMWQVLSSSFVGSVSLLKNKQYFAQKMHNLKSKEIMVSVY